MIKKLRSTIIGIIIGVLMSTSFAFVFADDVVETLTAYKNKYPIYVNGTEVKNIDAVKIGDFNYIKASDVSKLFTDIDVIFNETKQQIEINKVNLTSTKSSSNATYSSSNNLRDETPDNIPIIDTTKCETIQYGNAGFIVVCDNKKYINTQGMRDYKGKGFNLVYDSNNYTLNLVHQDTNYICPVCGKTIKCGFTSANEKFRCRLCNEGILVTNDHEIIVENIPYVMIGIGAYCDLDYYENTLIPIMDKIIEEGK